MGRGKKRRAPIDQPRLSSFWLMWQGPPQWQQMASMGQGMPQVGAVIWQGQQQGPAPGFHGALSMAQPFPAAGPAMPCMGGYSGGQHGMLPAMPPSSAIQQPGGPPALVDQPPARRSRSRSRTASGWGATAPRGFPDDKSRLSTAFRGLGLSWLHGAKRVCPKKFRMSLISSCDPQQWPMFKLSQLTEEEVDALCGWRQASCRQRKFRSFQQRRKVMLAPLPTPSSTIG